MPLPGAPQGAAAALALLVLLSHWWGPDVAGGQTFGRVVQFEQEQETLSVERRLTPADRCITPAYPQRGPNSDWNNVKWIAPPAQCTVQGFPIEDVQAVFNFRRGFALGYTADVEDKTHLLPYLRAAHDLNLHTNKRRVLLDLGGSYFETSTLWFLRMYPLAFSEIYVFEASKGKFVLPPHSDRNFKIVESIDSGSIVGSEDRSFLPNRVLDRIQLLELYVGLEDYQESAGRPGQVNITRFILDELKLGPDDTLIMKMDVEGLEWTLLPLWMQVPNMANVIDEIFVEIHYSDKTMEKFGWLERYKAKTREDAVRLFDELRSKGFFVHAWP